MSDAVDQQGARAHMRERELARRLIFAVLTPVTMLLIVGLVLAYQVKLLSDNGTRLERADDVIRQVQDVLASIVDQETGIRGYLLTEDVTFLEPYESAAPLAAMKDLRRRVRGHPVQVSRIQALEDLYIGWYRRASQLTSGDLKEARQLEDLRARKRSVDQMRALLADMLAEELAQKKAREVAFRESKTNAQMALVLVLTGATLVLAVVSRRQVAAIARTYKSALSAEADVRESLAEESWIRVQLLEIAKILQGEPVPYALSERCLTLLASAVEAEVGAIYIAEPEGLRRSACYAWPSPMAAGEVFAWGQGLVGQAASENRVLRVHDVPQGYLHVRSGTGASDPAELVLVPLRSGSAVTGVLELGFLRAVAPRVISMLERVSSTIGGGIESARQKQRLEELLEETQRQAEELQAQQDQLRIANEELTEQRTVLLEAQHRTQLQQTELEQNNETLARHSAMLEQQNEELREARDRLTAKTLEVEKANRYKSEFLANMSHELRTPLNSSLILARLLADNREQNLTPDQVRYAETIYRAGNDLLALINDVLDLSRIEAGRIALHPSSRTLGELVESLVRTFEPVANEKAVHFVQRYAPDATLGASSIVHTDVQRVEQVMKNMLSNAFKFTLEGSVELLVKGTETAVEIRVKDSGVGIAEEAKELIFEAFRQADGTTHRRFGGTGLGLSISRDLARRLGGDLVVEHSALGEGSTFLFTFPRVLPWEGAQDARNHAESEGAAPERPRPSASAGDTDSAGEPVEAGSVEKEPRRRGPRCADDRAHLDASRRLILVVEDDVPFATILLELAHELDFQCVVAATAQEAMQLATQLAPSGIVLDIGLPDHSGLSVLDRLKRDQRTRHIPVHIVSVADHVQRALSMGAVGYDLKPVKREHLVRAFRRLEATLERRVHRVLVVEDDPRQLESVVALLEEPAVELVAVPSVEEALEALRTSSFDCVITDLGFSGASGFDLLETISQDERYSFPPTIVYTARALTPDEEQRLRRYSSSIIVKGARSPERLLDEVSLFLHRVEKNLPPEHQRMLRAARSREDAFEGRHILLVEDDVRNVFALTSVLEGRGARLSIARNGREAIESLERLGQVDLVLMDLMMPEMDGLTATRHIRQQRKWQKLPIIALTAKAMPDDQEKCLEAGANDYVAKPFDVDMLLSLMRVWLANAG